MNEKDFVENKACPRWIKDVFRFLPVRSQYVLSNNIRDFFPFPTDNGSWISLPLGSYLASALGLLGYRYFLSYNMATGFSVVVPGGGDPKQASEFFSRNFKLTFDDRGCCAASRERAMEIMKQVVAWRNDNIAFFADFASQYVVRIDSLLEKEHEFFRDALLLSHTATPTLAAAEGAANRVPLFNPIFWLVEKENDLPDWLIVDNPRLRSLVLPRPDHILRRPLIETLTKKLTGYEKASAAEQKEAVDVFVEQTEGLMLCDVNAITMLCKRENLQFSEIGEAVRRFKVGVTEDPWKRIDRDKIEEGEARIRLRVKGQNPAIVKTLDIIKRAITGLSGAQGSKIGGKPRGVMFLAGPTGTGKTELAKTITELLFGDEKAYIRFDMSEFSAEHADQRLLGAPPGYVGYDAGGELTNAIREKPFSVVLFDEIEKANPRILDKFLQLLDDGVLTSGRGERVYFSESVVIFTSNLGIFKDGPSGERVPNVTQEDSYEVVAAKIRAEIHDFFTLKLNRPELLNRIGENIVVFDWIRKDVAVQIFEKMTEQIAKRLEKEQKIKVKLRPDVRDVLLERCTRNLENGGRGIGNQLEALLVNPLARALFDQEVGAGSTVDIVELKEDNGVPTLVLSR